MNHAAIVNALDSPIFGKSLLSAYLRVNEALFRRLPSPAMRLAPLRAYGELLNAIVRLRTNRTSYFGTFFMRNRPLLELAVRLIDRDHKASVHYQVAVVACSIGAEVYSISRTLRACCPARTFSINAVDISPEAVEFARTGIYALAGSGFTDENIFACLSEREMDEFFHAEDGRMRVRDWIREGIAWRSGNAADSAIADVLGPQDVVFANNFLCHLHPAVAEKCLRNIVTLVKPGGYLFVSGVDLDVRARVARELALEPVTEMIEEIHEGDSALRKSWPFRYWGLEPFNRRRHDWEWRYASAFCVGAGSSGATGRQSRKPVSSPAG